MRRPQSSFVYVGPKSRLLPVLIYVDCCSVELDNPKYSNFLPERLRMHAIMRTGTQQREIIFLCLPQGWACVCCFVHSLRLCNLFDYLMYQLKISLVPPPVQLRLECPLPHGAHRLQRSL